MLLKDCQGKNLIAEGVACAVIPAHTDEGVTCASNPSIWETEEKDDIQLDNEFEASPGFLKNTDKTGG